MNQTPTIDAKRRRLTAALFSVFAAAAAFAQTDAMSDKKDESVTLDKFVVTGSLLPKTEGETFVPVSTYSSLRLLQLGAATPIEGLRTLPSFFGSTSTELDSNGGTGAATVNLRGLGGTLTLINGRRAGANATSGFTDLNLIPIDAIQTIDILKDGAGSVYGADALAGVVNVVLKKKWIGQQIRTSYGISDKGDAQQWDASVALGRAFADNRGYFTLVGSYADKDTLFARDRALSANADGRFFGGLNGGSPTFAGHIGSAGAGLLLNKGLQFGTSAADYHPFDPSTESYNFRETSPTIPGQTRKLLHFAAGYELYKKQVEPYVEFDWGNQFTANALAAAPISLDNTATRNSVYNPFGPAGTAIPGNTVRYRGTDAGNRESDYDKTDYRGLIGVRGTFDNGWGYDTAYLKTNEALRLTEKNGVSNAAITAAINSGAFNPFALAGTTGTFRGKTWDNHAALLGALASGRKPFDDTLETYDFKLFGPAMELPAGAVNVALGYEWRYSHSTFQPDPIYFKGDLLGYNSDNPFDASAKNNAFYGEVAVPVLSAKNDVPWIKDLSVTGNIRYDNASVRDNLAGNGHSFGSDTKRIGLRYQPVDELVIRASYGTGFRVPTLAQLFAAPGSNNPTLIDPLRFPIGQQTETTTQGNPDLSPETSVSKGLGIVYSPKAVSGLNITVDYYKTRLSGLVTDGAQFILNQNAATQGPGFVPGNPATINPNALFADRIKRNPTTGELDDSDGPAVDSTNLNVAQRTAEGIDYTISYRQPKASWGQLTHTLEFNQVLKWDLVPEAGSPAQDFKGRFVDPASDAIAPGSIPEWKGYYNLLWEKGAWTASLTVNYIHSVQDDPNAQFLDSTGHFAYIDRQTGNIVQTNDISMERFVSFDLSASYTFQTSNHWLKGSEVRLGVQNLGDEPPPFSAGAFNDNYDTSLYSTRGRFFQLSFVQKF